MVFDWLPLVYSCVKGICASSEEVRGIVLAQQPPPNKALQLTAR
jgi:hypothetical protein